MPNYKLYKYDDTDTEAISPQYGFHVSRKPIQIFGGAFANGKTTALVMKAIGLAMDYPGSNGLLARETYPKLNDTLRKVFLEWCPKSAIRRKPSQEDNTCYLVNGSVVNFRYVAQRGKTREDGSTTSNLLSATYDWIGVDQVEDPGITHKDFQDLLGRLRGSTAYRPKGADDPTMPSTGPRWLMLTSNPSHTWFYKEIVQPFITYRDRGLKTEKLLVDGQTGLPIIDLFEGSTYTNARNLPEDYIRNLEASYKGQMRERFLLGKWAAFEGLVYGHFDDANVISREQALEHILKCRQKHVKIQVVEAYDYGLASPTCYGLFIVDDYGRIVLIDGFYEAELPYSEHAGKIFDIRNKYAGLLASTSPVLADPSIFKRTMVSKMNTGSTMADLLFETGLRLRPANNDIASGIGKVSAYIAGAMGIPHLVTGLKPAPLLYVCDDLQWWLDEIYSYYWKRNPEGTFIDEPMDNRDHAMDMTKYALSFLPHPSEIQIPENLLPPAWMRWQEMSDEQMRARRSGFR